MNQCNVWACENRAEYVNPRSGMFYCLGHYNQLHGRVIYDTARRDVQILVKLTQWRKMRGLADAK